MVIKFKFESEYKQREVNINLKEKSLPELIANSSKIKWVLDKFMSKSEHLIGIEEYKSEQLTEAEESE